MTVLTQKITFFEAFKNMEKEKVFSLNVMKVNKLNFLLMK